MNLSKKHVGLAYQDIIIVPSIVDELFSVWTKLRNPLNYALEYTFFSKYLKSGYSILKVTCEFTDLHYWELLSSYLSKYYLQKKATQMG